MLPLNQARSFTASTEQLRQAKTASPSSTSRPPPLATPPAGGRVFDGIHCMGGGYYPRPQALGEHLAGALPADYVSTEFHLNPRMRPFIDRGSQAMQDLLDAQGAG